MAEQFVKQAGTIVLHTLTASHGNIPPGSIAEIIEKISAIEPASFKGGNGGFPT